MCLPTEVHLFSLKYQIVASFYEKITINKEKQRKIEENKAIIWKNCNIKENNKRIFIKQRISKYT